MKTRTHAKKRTVITVSPEMHRKLKGIAQAHGRFLEATVNDILAKGLACDLASRASPYGEAPRPAAVSVPWTGTIPRPAGNGEE